MGFRLEKTPFRRAGHIEGKISNFTITFFGNNYNIGELTSATSKEKK